MRLGLVILLALCQATFGEDTQLDVLHSSLVPMRKNSSESAGPRGATPQLTVAKHQLRDWLESRLSAFSQRGDEGEFQRKLNSELHEAKLFCGTGEATECPDQFLNGFLGDVALKRESSFLVLQTSLGIECGFDESAYVYSWSNEGWRRVWQTEQNSYTDKEYKPQTLHAVLISPYNRENDYLVLTLGSQPWCSSVWHPVYYRAYRMGPDLSARPLLNGEVEWANVSDDPPIRGSVSANDVLVEFWGGSIDSGRLSRQTVRHYRIEGNSVIRVAPLALRPRDFVDEWLTTDWREASSWSESEDRQTSRDWHAKLHKDSVSGEFIYPTMHCPSMPDLWQVGVNLSNPPTPSNAQPKGTYFLVRWRPPYQFTMVQVSDRASPACSEEDRNADEDHHTLFPH